MVTLVAIIFGALILGGIARVLLVFTKQVRSLPAIEQQVKRQRFLMIAFAEIMGGVFGLFCVVTGTFTPFETVIGVVLATGLLEIAIRNRSPKIVG
jgi:hypothetical protein